MAIAPVYLSMSRLISCLIALIAVVSPGPATAADAVTEFKVLASIQPLAVLARDLLGDSGRVETLLPPGASPHHFALRVSDMRRLRGAHLVVWVGPELERFLSKPMADIAPGKSLSLADLDALQWPVATMGSHYGSGRDPHIWLNPRNGMVMVKAMAAQFTRLRPAAAADIAQRAERLLQQLSQLHSDIGRRLMALEDKRFLVYHDGYGHFVQAYGLQQAGFVTDLVDRRPGAGHLHQLQQSVAGAGCLLVDSAHLGTQARRLSARLQLPLIELEPYGRDSDTYVQLIGRLVDAFHTCLNVVDTADQT